MRYQSDRNNNNNNNDDAEFQFSPNSFFLTTVLLIDNTIKNIVKSTTIH